MNAASLASPGFGLGLRTAHYQDFLTAPQPVDWLEIITDNFLVAGGKPLVMLDALRRDYPIAMHGVAMSIGSAAGLDLDYLAKVKALARRVEPMWISDHLCWTGARGNVLHDLYPMPYTEESARLLIAQIRQAQDVLERRLVIENVSSYVRFASSRDTEWAFLAHVIEEADCELLLDVNNVYVSSVNHGFSAQDYLDGLPTARVRQIHLAGHSVVDDHIIDTHDHPVSPEVWALYAAACRRFPHVATMIERDDHIPPLPALIAELDQARAIAARQMSESSQLPAQVAHHFASSPCPNGELSDTQLRLADYIVGKSPTSLPPDLDQSGPLPGARGMQIYHRAYRERLAEVLADSFPKCQLFLGTSLFKDLAERYIDAHPPRERHLGRYGSHFATLLEAAYPENAELSDLARLEWDLRTAFDAADVPAWTVPDIEQTGPDTCLGQDNILHPSLRLQSIRTNAVSIWRAIDSDNEVPEVVRWADPHTLAVWRKDLRPHFRSVEDDEAAFLLELLAERATITTVAHAWGESGRLRDPAVLGRWLAGWWSDELLRRAVTA